MVDLLPPPDCPACGRPMKRVRKPSDLQFECGDAACRASSEIAARWIASELKPPSR